MQPLDTCSRTSFWGQNLDGKEKLYPDHSNNLNSLERYLSFLEFCTLLTIRNLRFFILLKAEAFNDTVIGLGSHHIMPRILSDPWIRQRISCTS